MRAPLYLAEPDPLTFRDATLLSGRNYNSGSPDLAGGVDAQLQLRLLLLDGQVVAVVGAGKAALRAQAKVFQRHDLRGLADSLLEKIPGFELREFRGNQSQHHLL